MTGLVSKPRLSPTEKDEGESAAEKFSTIDRLNAGVALIAARNHKALGAAFQSLAAPFEFTSDTTYSIPGIAAWMISMKSRPDCNVSPLSSDSDVDVR